MRQTTICFLIKDDSILLAMKKRGHGIGKWNGVGGKLSDGETAEAAAIREAEEEISVIPRNLMKVGSIDFIFPPERNFNHQSIVYLCDKWVGEPAESEEMMPKWFNIKAIPYNEMWESDAYWLPKILLGQKIKATVESDQNDKIVSYKEQEAGQ